MKKIILTISLFSLLFACGGSDSVTDTDSPDSSVTSNLLEGNWQLGVNGCNGYYVWDESINVSFNSDLSDGYELYDVDSALGQFSAYFNTADNTFAMCLSPAGELDFNQCYIECTGTYSDGLASLYCETDISGSTICGPVIYSIQ